MDLIDKEILMELDSDCRVSYQTLADKIGISSNSIRRRIENLMETGTIERLYVKLRLEMLDADMLLSIIQTDGFEDSNTFISNLSKSSLIEQVSAIACGNGGLYVVYAIYRGSRGLASLSSFLRRQKHVRDVEMHTLLVERGKRVELNNIHLKVLSCLLESPRIPMVEIRKKIHMSIKKIRKTIEFLQSSGAIHFGTQLFLGANGVIEYLVKIVLDEKRVSNCEVIDWLNQTFATELWAIHISATEPVIFARFVVDNMHHAEELLRKIRVQKFIKFATGFVHYSSTEVSLLGESEISQMIEAAGV